MIQLNNYSSFNTAHVSSVDKEESKKPLERIATLDFQRGLSIFIMVFIHSAANIIDSSYIENDPSVITEMPIYIIIILAVLAFFGMWNSYFLLISVTVNSYAMAKGVINDKDPKKILVKQMITGIGLLIINAFQQSFLAKGYFGQVLITGDWSNFYPMWNGFFSMGTLRIIGYCMILNSILLYFLLQNDGYKQFKRNITILGVLALGIIVSSEFIHHWVDNLNWIIPEQLPSNVSISDNTHWPNEDLQALNLSAKAWFCVIISGNIEPLFPFLATAFIGAIIGLCLAQPEQIKKLPLIGNLTGLGLMISGGIFVAFGFFAFGTRRPPIGNYLVMIGGQLIVFFMLLWLVEYRGKSQKFGNHPVVKHFRLWGMLSLTLFVLDILDVIPRMIFGLLYNLIFSTNINTIPGKVFGSGQEHIAIIYALFALLFFELVVYLWSRVNFFLSFEWLIVHLVGKITNIPSKRLNVELMMNDVNWINFRTINNQNAELVTS